MILSISDFENGIYKIPVNPSQEVDLETAIKDAQNKYLPKLFGVELYNLFLADLALPTVGEPTAPRFVAIFEPLLEKVGDFTFQSEGIKEMLKGFTYFHNIRELPTEVTTTGIKKTESDNSTNATAVNHDVARRYNDAVSIFKVIQCFIEEKEEVYPEFDGSDINYSHTF